MFNQSTEHPLKKWHIKKKLCQPQLVYRFADIIKRRLCSQTVKKTSPSVHNPISWNPMITNYTKPKNEKQSSLSLQLTTQLDLQIIKSQTASCCFWWDVSSSLKQRWSFNDLPKLKEDSAIFIGGCSIISLWRWQQYVWNVFGVTFKWKPNPNKKSTSR